MCPFFNICHLSYYLPYVGSVEIGYSPTTSMLNVQNKSPKSSILNGPPSIGMMGYRVIAMGIPMGMPIGIPMGP